MYRRDCSFAITDHWFPVTNLSCHAFCSISIIGTWWSGFHELPVGFLITGMRFSGDLSAMGIDDHRMAISLAGFSLYVPWGCCQNR